MKSQKKLISLIIVIMFMVFSIPTQALSTPQLSPIFTSETIIADASTTVNASDGYMPLEEYYPSYSTQVAAYGNAMGGCKSTVNGTLKNQGQFFAMRAWFSTPIEYANDVTDITWVYYVSPDA